MTKRKEKPMTHAEIRKIVRAEVIKFMKGFAETAAEQKATKLENAIGFRWCPPEPEIGDEESYDNNRKPKRSSSSRDW